MALILMVWYSVLLFQQDVDQLGQVIHTHNTVACHVGTVVVKRIGMIGQQIVDQQRQVIHVDMAIPIHISGQCLVNSAFSGEVTYLTLDHSLWPPSV